MTCTCRAPKRLSHPTSDTEPDTLRVRNYPGIRPNTSSNKAFSGLPVTYRNKGGKPPGMVSSDWDTWKSTCRSNMVELSKQNVPFGCLRGQRIRERSTKGHSPSGDQGTLPGAEGKMAPFGIKNSGRSCRNLKSAVPSRGKQAALRGKAVPLNSLPPPFSHTSPCPSRGNPLPARRHA